VHQEGGEVDMAMTMLAVEIVGTEELGSVVAIEEGGI
jgi:hypothetical protein